MKRLLYKRPLFYNKIMESLLNRLLKYFQISQDEYEKLLAPVSEENFAIGHSFKDIDKCVEVVKEAMKQNKKIYIYGDYDCDGIMSISILVKMFSYFGYPVDYYVPSRYLDGYGLTLKHAEEIVEQGYNLLITVDNGITAFEGIEYCKNKGMQVLVFDHHQADETLPVADYILHPVVSHFGEVPTSAGFVTFMFAKECLGRYDQYLATLAGISIISDMMPVKEYNRNLLKLVIEEYEDGQFFNIDLLKEKDTFNEGAIGMRIAPKVNAVGRLVEDEDSLTKTVKFFTSDDKNLLLNYNEWINSVNAERKELTKVATENSKEIDTSKPAIIAVINEKEGVIGLLANNFAKKYLKPTIIFALDQSGEYYKGSCRAPKGFNVVDAFNKLDKYMLTAGGHESAGGCSVKKDCFEEFKVAFNELAEKAEIKEEMPATIDLYLNEITRENYDLIQSFSPFGEGWQSPKFKLSRIRTQSLMYSRDAQHILTSIGQAARLTGFYFPKTEISQYQFVDMIGTFRLSTYYGKTTVEFLISDIYQSEK